MTRLRLGMACLLIVAASGCSKTSVESWLAEEQTDDRAALYAQEPFVRALHALKKRIGPDAQALSLLVYANRIVLQIQVPDKPQNVDQYVYRGGQVAGPVPVKLMGTGALEDNLFPLKTARLEGIPKLIEAARAKVDMPEGKIDRVLLKRNLPESMDIMFRVFVTSQRRDAQVDADKDCNIID